METLKRIILLLILSIPLWGETQTRKALLLVDISGEFSHPEQAIIMQTLRTGLSSQDTVKILLSGEFPEQENENRETLNDRNALYSGADSWIDITITGRRENLKVQWQIRDMQENFYFPDGSFEDSIDSSYLTLYGGFWHPLIVAIEESLVPMETTGTLTIKALPGTEILGIEEVGIILDDSGSFSTRLSAPGFYSLGLKLEGYYSEQQVFFLSKDEIEQIEVNQKEISPFSMKAYLYMVSFPSFSLQYEIPKTAIYTGLGMDQFFLGFVPNKGGDEDIKPSLFQGVGLIYPYIESGYILETKKGLLRIPIGGGIFLRMTPYNETTALLDPISPFGFFISASAEYRVFRNISIYYEMRPTIYFTGYPTFFDEAFDEDGFARVAIGDNLRADLMLQMIGIRWTP